MMGRWAHQALKDKDMAFFLRLGAAGMAGGAFVNWSKAMLSNLLSGEDVYNADEAFVTGTFAGVIPVIEIDGRTMSKGYLTKELQKLFLNGFLGFFTTLGSPFVKPGIENIESFIYSDEFLYTCSPLLKPPVLEAPDN